MDFAKFNKKLQKHVSRMCYDAPRFHVVNVDKDLLWETYLSSFPEGTNQIYRTRREYDCSCCRQFIKNFGNVVSIIGGQITTIWDFDAGEFQPVVDALSCLLRSHPITHEFVTDVLKFGIAENHERAEDGSVKTWTHLNVTLPAKFRYTGNKTIDTVIGHRRDVRNVFKRGLDEITDDSISTVLEIIAQGSLYRGEEWTGNLKSFRKAKEQYDALPSGIARELYSWELSGILPEAVAKLRGHSMGTLLLDISNGEDLDTAVRKFEAIMAPENYKRPKAIYTAKMVEAAEKTLAEHGLLDSLPRRFARLDDITHNNVLFADRDTAKKVLVAGHGSVLGTMKEEAKKVNPKSFEKLEEIPADKFVQEILPLAKHVEVFFDRKHIGNLVSLIAPANPDAKSLLKWDNGFSWNYKGNVADSMKERVKAAGGKVDGELRFSIQWNEDGKSIVDLDAHAHCPGNVIICYSNKRPGNSNGGFLDVDMINPSHVGVENITWPTGTKMRPGKYLFRVRNFSNHLKHDGFDAEIEFNGEIHSFSYRKAFRNIVDVAEVTVGENNTYTIKPLIESSSSTVSGPEAWGIATGKFHPVTVCAYSPNFWDGASGIGNRHYLFMLQGCANPDAVNGFFNEFLRPEFEPHRRVFEALGARMLAQPTEDQLSGLGFSTTKRDALVVRVEGSFTRVLKVIF